MAEHLDHNKAPQLTNLVFALLDHRLKEYATVFFFFFTEMDLSLTVSDLKEGLCAVELCRNHQQTT